MGLCGEFGAQIHEGCAHLMLAEEGHCSCPHCGASCTGRFTGCEQVWATAVLKLAPAPTPPAVPALVETPEPPTEDRKARVGTAPEREATDSFLDSLREPVMNLLYEIGWLARRLEQKGTHSLGDSAELMTAGALRVVLRDLDALADEIRVKRTQALLRAPAPEPPGETMSKVEADAG